MKSGFVIFGVVVVGFLTTQVAVAQGQTTTRNEAFERVTASSRDPSVIKGQLRLASKLGRQTLEGLQAAPTDNSPMDESVHDSARKTYVLIRAARHGFVLIQEWNEGRKGVLPDPIMDLAFRRVDAAWNLSRFSVDGWNSSLPRQEYLTRATEDLGQALRLVDQALAIMP
jgi:hypothetical protein